MTATAWRSAGVLLHLGSLPGASIVGALGMEARRFLDFLADCGFRAWAMLPIGPVDSNHSPYQSVSSYAGDMHLVSLDTTDLGLDAGSVAHCRQAIPQHHLLLELNNAFDMQADAARRQAAEEYRARNRHWLADYSLYRALKLRHDHEPWWQWPEHIRDREPSAMRAAEFELRDLIEAYNLEQYLFWEQWRSLHDYARQRSIELIGDVPMFVAADSCDVWANRTLFKLDSDGQPQRVAGVPPDYFSSTGQRWGNPVYRWTEHLAEDFGWWSRRVEHQLCFFDRLRLDHFRGFAAAWEIPRESPTAERGGWVPAPGAELLAKLEQRLGSLPLIAEDLGTITPDVVQLRRRFKLPGMAVLQFAFDNDASNPYLPHNQERHSVVYTGTHDNNTTLGWFDELDARQRARVLEYLGYPDESMPWPLIRAGLASVAELCLLPLQDLLGLQAAHRLNTPGTIAGNWQWRFQWDWIEAGLAGRIRRMNELYGRLG